MNNTAFRQKNFYLVILLSIVVYLAIIFYSDLSGILKSIKDVDFNFLLYSFIFVLLGFVLRALRWNYFLESLGISINKWVSYLICFSGFTMSLTPLKSGEVIKSYYLKEYNGTRISRSAPIFVMERFSDFAGLTLISIVSMLSFKFEITQISLISILLLAIFLVLINSRQTKDFFLLLLTKFYLTKPHASRFKIASEQFTILSSPKFLFPSLLYSLLIWSLECLSFYFIIKSTSYELNIFKSAFIFSTSSLVGALSMIPGGLGATELSLIGQLRISAIDSSTSAMIGLMIRFFTLWLSVFVGIIATKPLLNLINNSKHSRENTVRN